VKTQLAISLIAPEAPNVAMHDYGKLHGEETLSACVHTGKKGPEIHRSRMNSFRRASMTSAQ
jgi:hypothetical protein